MKQTVFDHIRDHIFNYDTLRGRKESEWCVEFENLMRNRLFMITNNKTITENRPDGVVANNLH